jgi:hypothetical protein
MSSDSVAFQPNTDSTTFFQVLDADAGNPIVNVDSTNERFGVGTNAPLCLFQVTDGTISTNDWHDATYDKFLFVGTDFQFALVDTDDGSWGASMIFRQVDGNVYENSWAMIRQTNGDGAGDGSLRYTYGTALDPTANTSVVTFTTGGVIKSTGGAQLGDGGTTDYLQVESDGTIEFNGAATVWDDFVVPVQVASRSTVPGTTAPNELAYRSGLVYEFPDAVDRTCYFVIQLPHTYKEGTNVVFHIHWTIDTSGAGGGAENVEWDYSYSASSPTSDNSEQWPVATTGTQTVDVQNEAQHDHIMDDIVTITGTNFKISEVIIMSLTRTGTTDSYGGHALLVSADVHHEIDTVGSRQITTK